MGTVHRADSDAKLLRYLRPGSPLLPERGYPADVDDDLRASEPVALGASCFESGLNSLRDSDPLLFRHCGNDGDNSVFEDPARIEILLGESSVADAVGRKAVEMLERFQHPLA